jgi:hypothetical protein
LSANSVFTADVVADFEAGAAAGAGAAASDCGAAVFAEAEPDASTLVSALAVGVGVADTPPTGRLTRLMTARPPGTLSTATTAMAARISTLGSHNLANLENIETPVRLLRCPRERTDTLSNRRRPQTVKWPATIFPGTFLIGLRRRSANPT